MGCATRRTVVECPVMKDGDASVGARRACGPEPVMRREARLSNSGKAI